MPYETIGINSIMARAMKEFTPIYARQIAAWMRDAKKIRSLKISDAELLRVFRPLPQEFGELFSSYVNLAALRGQIRAEMELRMTPERAIADRKRFDLESPITVTNGYIESLGNAIDTMSRRPIFSKQASRALSDLGKSLAFYVDKIENLNMAARAKEIVKEFLRENRTVLDFQREFPQRLGTARFTLSHLETILRTNIMQSFNVARIVSFRDAGVPAAQYIAITDDALTEICRPFHLAVVRFDSNLFARISPLQHHRCRCLWSPVTDRMLRSGEFKFKPKSEIEPHIQFIKKGFKEQPQSFDSYKVFARNYLAEKMAKFKKI